jgi:ParB-like chromosome segregation protein Spo0J
MKTKTVPAASLVEDFSLYPRNTVSDTHVNDLARALSAGDSLPPIVAEKGTLRIVDGVHRRRAHIKAFGDEATVEVDLRTYENEAELYLEAVRFNSAHGRKLDRHDQTRIVLRLQELQVEPSAIALALHVPEQEIRTLAIRVVYDEAGTAVPQKRGLEHLRGTVLRPEQVTAMKSVRSAEVGRLCLELTRLIEHDLVDYEDSRVVDRLMSLNRVLFSAVERIKVPA